jgi:hypothetical protein
MRWKIPALSTFNWQMKTIDSAVTNLTIDKFGAMHMHIDHDVIKGVTPKMLEWWFRNIGGEMEYQGKNYSKYHIWHPFDHIHWSLANKLPNNAVGVGSRFHIVEALGRDRKMLIDIVDEVKQLDKMGITLSGKFFGLAISCLCHKFIAVENGTKYISHLKIGNSSILGKYIINPIIRRFFFGSVKGYAWIKHNIEEVGNFERFLPALFEKESCT